MGRFNPMKSRFLPLLCVALLSGCVDDITVHIAQDPGSISGIVFPVDAQAAVRLYQDELIAETTTNDTGRFRFEEVDPGNYILWISADGYGSKKIDNIEMEAGAGRFLGEIQLYTFPWPLTGFAPGRGRTDVDPYATREIRIYFNDVMNTSSVKSSISIAPPVTGLAYAFYNYDSPPHKSYVAITGDFDWGVAYTFSLGANIKTATGQPIESAYDYSFTTIPFSMTLIETPFSATAEQPYGNNEFEVYFNAPISTENIADHLLVSSHAEQTVEVILNPSSRNLRIRPLLAWPAAGPTSITLKSTLPTAYGALLGHDSTFTFYMDSLDVAESSPYDGQYYVRRERMYISIQFNSLIDESTLEDAFSMFPLPALDLNTYRSGGQSRLSIYPDTLLAATTYTVTIDTSLKDFWGGDLVAPYSFSFTTQ